MQIRNHSTFLLAAALLLNSLFHSCQNTNKPLVVLYDEEFNTVKEMAKKENKAFCIVLSRPDCPPCELYIQNLGDWYAHLSSKVIFNIVNVSLPENAWYLHWLCSGGSPMTCVFSANGELKAVIASTKKNARQCFEASITGDAKCADYFYDKHYSATIDHLQALNALLLCKQSLDKGEDIGNAVDVCLRQSQHPYPVYLKLQNAVKQGRNEEAVYWANRFLSMINTNSYQSRVYNNIHQEVKTIINPNYASADDDGKLSVVEELPLGNCKLHQPQPFSLTLSNTGRAPLSVYDMNVSCSCVKLQGERQLTLQPGQSQKVDFIFTADVAGDILREVTFFSDGANPMQTVRITAVVK
jgi:hypothetical protein